jgi:hypothetical protein
MSWTWGWLRPEEASFDAVLERLLHEASEAIPGLSADPKQADPVVVMLLRAFAREYSALYRLMDDSLGLAYRTLVSRLLSFPRAPEPATTVLRLEAKDPGARVPLDFQAVASQSVPLPGGRSGLVHFSPIRESRISSFNVAALVFVDPSGAATRLPDPPYPGLAERWQARPRPSPALFVALDAAAPGSADRAEIFLFGDSEGVRSCLWSRWQIPERAGGAGLSIQGGRVEPPFVPAQEYHRQVPFDPPLFTFRSDLRRQSSLYEPQLVAVGGMPLLSQACPAPSELGPSALGLPPAHGTRHWVRILLPADIVLETVRGVRARTNSVLAANRELRMSGAQAIDETPIHSWALPDDVSFENLVGIDRVIDLKTGHEYVPAGSREGLDALRTHDVEEWIHDGVKRVRVGLLNRDPQRRRTEVQIDYSLTLGAAANGLGPGTVNVAFTPPEVFPGLVSVTNLVPTVGGRPARSEEEEEELRTALRARGRAVVADDFLQMARSFDPVRIRDVELSRGVARGLRGLRSSVVVSARTRARDFVSPLERDSFQRRLAAYLQDRCSIGETVEVRLVEDSG